MRSRALTALCIGLFSIAKGQPSQVSLGIFTGVTAPFTYDAGINRDSRYQPRYQLKLAPIGIAYGIDYNGFGFVITPSLVNIGQNMDVVNSLGGTEGTRDIDMRYVQLPVALKLHVIDRPFLKVSLVAGAGAGYLLGARETITHNNAKYRFPAELFPILPQDYVVEYDGVIAPKVEDLEIVAQDDFNTFQIFGSLGFRSDLDLNESWRFVFDVRANYGFNETRTDGYRARALANQALYDLHGNRREMFAHLSLGISRYMDITRKKRAAGKSNPKRKSRPAWGRRSPKS